MQKTLYLRILRNNTRKFHMNQLITLVLSLFDFSCPVPTSNGINSGNVCFERPPSILVPLKVHTPPKGYQLYMTCAVRGCPTPSVSWYLKDVCINSDKNYYITNSCGVCSLYILRVRPVDSGEYKVVAINPLGKAECTTKVIVRGKSSFDFFPQNSFVMFQY